MRDKCKHPSVNVQLTLVTFTFYLVVYPTNSNILDEHGTGSLSYVVSLFFIDDLTYWFFVFNCFQIKLLLSLLFTFGFYYTHISKHKILIDRSKIPTISKMEIFVREINGGSR